MTESYHASLVLYEYYCSIHVLYNLYSKMVLTSVKMRQTVGLSLCCFALRECILLPLQWTSTALVVIALHEQRRVI